MGKQIEKQSNPKKNTAQQTIIAMSRYCARYTLRESGAPSAPERQNAARIIPASRKADNAVEDVSALKRDDKSPRLALGKSGAPVMFRKLMW